jgi:hypothetical protein
MSDHMHKAGEWMLGLSYGRELQSGDYRSGSGWASDADLSMAGYSMKAERMTMQMVMPHLMYGVSDRVNLMVMPMYMNMTMVMAPVPGAMPMPGHGGAASFEHGTAGWGDTEVSALVRLYDDGENRVQLGLGVSVPTGSVSEKNADGTLVHYEMQLGSGAWDVLPSLTYVGRRDGWSWGAQLGGVVRTGGYNDSGYRLGDAFRATAWGARRLNGWLSASARLAYRTQGRIEGGYTAPHKTKSPADRRANYGGQWTDLGLGLNAVVPSGPLAGHRLGVEWVQPLVQRPNGVQLDRKGALTASWSKAF